MSNSYSTKSPKVMLIGAILAAAAVFGVVSVANASTTYSAGSGGFAGKGDLQTPWGWSDADLQNNWGGVAVSYKKQTTVDASCEWTIPDSYYTNGPKTGQLLKASYSDSRTQNRIGNVKGDITYEKRTSGKTAKVTGFTLNPVSNVATTGGSIPSIGDSCSSQPPGYTGTIVCVGSVVDSDGDGQVSDEPCVYDPKVMEVVTASYTGTTMTKVCTGSGRKQSCTYVQQDVSLTPVDIWKDGVSTLP